MKARFEQLRNDLFWRYYDYEEDIVVKWSGYDDDFWWNNIANTEKWQTQGKYRLNPETDEITIVEKGEKDE